MKIIAYCLVWNEEKMLHYYLRHYSQFCDRIIFYDNESTDSSRDIINSYANTEIRTYKTDGKLSDKAYKDLKTDSIKDSINYGADYVIITDCDEFIYHPNIRKFLKENLNKFSVFYPAGFQMASQSFPTTNGQLYHVVDRGEPNPWYSKPMLINPNLVGNLSYVDGCHEFDNLDEISAPIYHPVPESIRPIGEYGGHRWGKWQIMKELLHLFNEQPLKMLHYKFLGADFVNDRYRQYAERYSDYNLENNVAMHYKEAIEQNTVQKDIDDVLVKSVKVSL